LGDLERRGLKLSKKIIWVTDGGNGIIKALKDRWGKKLIHQRFTSISIEKKPILDLRPLSGNQLR